MTSPTADDAARWQLLYKETEFCVAAVRKALQLLREKIKWKDGRSFALDNERDLTIRALYVSSVITYGKLFSAIGKGRKKLERSEVFKGPGTRYLEFDRWLMDVQRNGYVAHAKKPDLEATNTYLLFYPDDKVTLDPHASFASSMIEPDYERFLEVLAYIQGHINQKRIAALDHVFEHDVLPRLRELRATASAVHLADEFPTGPDIPDAIAQDSNAKA